MNRPWSGFRPNPAAGISRQGLAQQAPAETGGSGRRGGPVALVSCPADRFAA